MAKTTSRSQASVPRSRRARSAPRARNAKACGPPILKGRGIEAGDVLLCVVDEPDRLTLRMRQRIGLYTHAAIALGRGRIADAGEDGVTTSSLNDLLAWSSRIGVLKGWIWNPEALAQLKRFVRWAVAQKGGFNFEGMRRAIAAREAHLGNIMEQIQADNTPEPSARKTDSPSYFCSEFVVACFADTGLIRGKAKIIFKPDTYTPRMLAEDRLFGEFRGYLLKPGGAVQQTTRFCIC